MEVFGLDIGGSGIKGAPVDLETGALVEERIRIPTPQAPTSEAVVETSLEVIRRFGWEGPVGVGFPGVIKDGVVRTAANVAKELIGFDLQGRLQREVGETVRVVNDADAAGLAEMRWGSGRGIDGVVLMLTLGTGIGTSLFVGGSLVPNMELGHIEIRGEDAEHRAADGARKREDLSWEQYAERLDEYLHKIEDLLWPDLIVVGGGISKKADRYFPHLTIRTEIVTATMLNEAGIAGAALAGIPDKEAVKVAE